MSKIKILLPDYVCRYNGLFEHGYYELTVIDRKISKWYYDTDREGGYYNVKNPHGELASILSRLSKYQYNRTVAFIREYTDHNMSDIENIILDRKKRLIAGKEAEINRIREEIKKIK